MKTCLRDGERADAQRTGGLGLFDRSGGRRGVFRDQILHTQRAIGHHDQAALQRIGGDLLKTPLTGEQRERVEVHEQALPAEQLFAVACLDGELLDRDGQRARVELHATHRHLAVQLRRQTFLQLRADDRRRDEVDRQPQDRHAGGGPRQTPCPATSAALLAGPLGPEFLNRRECHNRSTWDSLPTYASICPASSPGVFPTTRRAPLGHIRGPRGTSRFDAARFFTQLAPPFCHDHGEAARS